MKPLIYILIGTLGLIYVSSCRENDLVTNDATIIKGNIKFSKTRKIFLAGFKDSLSRFSGDKVVLDTAVIEPDGSFRFVLHPGSGNIYELRLNDSILMSDIYMSPKSQLSVFFNEKYKDPKIDTTNVAGKYIDYRVKLNRKFYYEPKVKNLYYIIANYMDVKQYDTFQQGRRNQMLAFYHHYFSKAKPDSAFDNYARSEINYQYDIDKLMYLWKHRIKDIDVFPDSSYYDFAAKANLENPKALGSPAYYHFLNLYIQNVYGEEIVKNAMAHKGPAPGNPVVGKYLTAVQNLSLPYRNIVLYNIISGDMSKAELDSMKHPGLPALEKWFLKKYPEIGSGVHRAKSGVGKVGVH